MPITTKPVRQHLVVSSDVVGVAAFLFGYYTLGGVF
jgi:hypothetical protein